MSANFLTICDIHFHVMWPHCVHCIVLAIKKKSMIPISLRIHLVVCAHNEFFVFFPPQNLVGILESSIFKGLF